jgi:histidinol-phosphate phosphatase family protein
LRVLGINAVFHDPAAALVVDGTAVAAAEEERLSRRKHGRAPVPTSALATRLRGSGAGERPAAVLFDRDGTLVADVPYNGEADRVALMPGAKEAVERLRTAGVPTAVVSNQSGVARGLVTMDQVEAVNRRVEDLLGPLGPWIVCPHHPGDGCGCRKPAPGMVLRAARELGVEPGRCALIGDIGADVEAARAAGARGVLVPTPATLPHEVQAAPEVAADLVGAVELLLEEAR